MRVAAITVLTLAVAGCGSQPGANTGAQQAGAVAGTTDALASANAPAPAAYAGPLSVPVTDPGSPDVRLRAGAAVGALECAGEPYLGESDATRDGDGSAKAARDKLRKQGWGYLPAQGYRVEREEPHRVLYSYDVAGKTKVAVIVADVPRPQSAAGWNVESFASCDPAEMPASITDATGMQVWTDRDGARVPTTVVVSFRGSEHCDWQSTTFLSLDKESYIRDPEGVLSGTTFRATFDPHATLPPTATDTGYRLGDGALWRVADKTAVYVVTGDSVERWPAPVQPVGCD